MDETAMSVADTLVHSTDELCFKSARRARTITCRGRSRPSRNVRAVPTKSIYRVRNARACVRGRVEHRPATRGYQALAWRLLLVRNAQSQR